MDFLAGMDEMLDMLDGYRAKLLARGYTDHAAERMTVRMHDLMLKNIEGQL